MKENNKYFKELSRILRQNDIAAIVTEWVEGINRMLTDEDILPCK